MEIRDADLPEVMVAGGEAPSPLFLLLHFLPRWSMFIFQTTRQGTLMNHSMPGRSRLFFGILASCLLLFSPDFSGAAYVTTPPIRDPQARHQRPEVPKRPYREVFSEIERTLAAGNANGLSGMFAAEVQVSLRGGENGYFSSHQAYYLLDSYLRNRRLANLSFTSIGESEVNPYATGGANLLYRGSREYVQVYVALSLSGDRWVISRINIY